MEGDALVENKGVAQAVIGHAPLFGQHWNDVGVRVEGDQRLIHRVGYGVGYAVARYVRVQMGGVRLHGNDQVIVRGFRGRFRRRLGSLFCSLFGLLGVLRCLFVACSTSAASACAEAEHHDDCKQE